MTAPSQAVFLSYASEDTEAAGRICEALRSAGVEVWFDRSALRGGEAWDASIRREIRTCALFIPLISANTHLRTEGYFRLEWKLAIDRSNLIAPDQAFLLPVVIDDTPHTDERIPERFRELQWTRLPNGEVSSAFVARIRQLLSSDAASEPGEPAASGAAATAGPRSESRGAIPSTPQRSRMRTAALLAMAALALGGAIYLALERLVPSKHAPPASTAITDRSIAVLPFVDMSEKHDQEYFADGMAEELIDLLTKIPELRVIGRTSSFSFKGRRDDLRSIGEKLQAAYVVEGSVRRSGNRIRVTAQLIDARSGTHVWSNAYDRDFDDVLSLQDQIASGIARALQLAVGADEARETRRLRNTDAYTFYLRGRAAIDRGDTTVAEAKSFLEQSLALDPSFLRAVEALALAHLSEIGGRLTPSRLGWPAAVDAARRAMGLDPRSAVAHAILGLERATYAYDWAAASAELDATLALKPRDPDALYTAAWLAFDLARHAEAIALQDAALAIDPLNPDSYQNGAFIRYLTGDLGAAERGFRRSLEISPTFSGSHRMLGEILLQRRQPAAALKEMEAEQDSARDVGLALAYFALGRRAESDRATASMERAVDAVGEVNIALVHAYRGERDLAFQWLDRAVTSRDINLGHRLKYDPIFDPLRGDPRYKALLRRMNLPE